jgi:GNAT superfamily N-acetyltransferase
MLIRPYQPGDEYKIVALFKQVFNAEMPIEYWRWRFGDGNPWGSTIVVAMDGDTMAAHYAVSHQNVTYHGRLPCSDELEHTVLTAQSMTTMTHPDYRGQGLFVKCARMCFEMAKEDGVKLVWSFPNKNSEKTFYGTLGWKRLGNVGLTRTERGDCSVGGSGHQYWRWGDGNLGPEYGALLLDDDYKPVMEALELHLEDSDVYTYERDCRRLKG